MREHGKLVFWPVLRVTSVIAGNSLNKLGHQPILKAESKIKLHISMQPIVLHAFASLANSIFGAETGNISINLSAYWLELRPQPHWQGPSILWSEHLHQESTSVFIISFFRLMRNKRARLFSPQHTSTRPSRFHLRSLALNCLSNSNFFNDAYSEVSRNLQWV